MDNKSPYTALYKKDPDYSMLRCFGCLCYASIHPADKFDSRAIQCIFLGYPYLQKGFKLLRLDTHSILVSRHVKFLEHNFPYHHISDSSTADKFVTPGNSYQFLDWLNTAEGTSSLSAPCSAPIPPEYTLVDDQNPGSSPSSVEIPDQDDSDSISTSSDVNILADQNPISTLTPSTKLTRQSIRAKNKPKWWADYHCKSAQLQTLPSNVVEHDQFDLDEQTFQAYSTALVEPNYYHQAAKDPKWIQAMQLELKALEANNTWALVPLPPGKTCVGSKWVYRIKYKANGEVERYKARLVAKSYTQSAGVDFHETFAPVVQMDTVRSLLAISAANNWFVEQLDVNNAFLYGDLEEEVYMSPPLGYVLPPSNVPLVCQLIKSIYGLRQASRRWFAKLTSCLLISGIYTHL